MKTNPTDPESAIRELIDKWQIATADGNLSELYRLMDDEVVFLVPGQPPMRGRDAFAASFQIALQSFRIESSCDVKEIQVAGDWAYCWTHLSVTVTPRQPGPPMRRSGYSLTVLRKKMDGAWVVTRDANMLTPDPSTTVEQVGAAAPRPAHRSLGGIIQPY